MNYDGMAIVIENGKEDFKSSNGFCDVIELNLISNSPVKQTLNNSAYVIDDNTYGIVPVSVQIKNNTQKEQEAGYWATAFVYTLIRANIVTGNFHVSVINKALKNDYSDVQFPYTTITVTDKSAIVIPDSTMITSLSLTIQKNNFTEIEFQNVPSNVTGLPDGLTWQGQYIKGTITKSGNYTIYVTYPDTKQIINIIVPYYQRLL